MTKALTHGRLLTALHIACYPAFEPAAENRFQALQREAENARGAGDLATCEKLYLGALSEAQASFNPSHLNLIRYDLARMYQEQRRYSEAELILREQLEKVNSSESTMPFHAAHMCLARFYKEQGKYAKAEEHY